MTDPATTAPRADLSITPLLAEAMTDPEGGDLLEGLPFSKDLGMRVLRLGSGEAALAIPYDTELIGDPETGVIHGGVVTALLDTCAGVACMNTDAAAHTVATLDLRIDYMRPATPNRTLLAHAICHRQTRLITFIRAVAFHDDPSQPVASAIGAFMAERLAPAGKPAAPVDKAST